MSELDKLNNNITTLVGSDVVQTGSIVSSRNDLPQTTSHMFNIDLDPTDPNFLQYCKTLRVCAEAAKSSSLDLQKEMTTAAKELGNRLTVIEVDAEFAKGFGDTERFKMIDPNHAAAMQLEEEKMDTAHQLPGNIPDKALVMISREVIKPPETSGSVDIVGVSRQEPTPLEQLPTEEPSSLDEERAQSPFFLKKAV